MGSNRLRPSARAVALLNGGVLVFSLSRVVVVWYAEPNGSPRVLEIVAVAVLYAWWAAALDASLRRHGGFASLLPLTLGWSFVVHGLLPGLDCVPPCKDATPQREIAVTGNLLLGAASSLVNAQLVLVRRDRTSWTRVVGGVILVIAVAAIETAAR